MSDNPAGQKKLRPAMARVTAGYASQKELADDSGIGLTTVSRIESVHDNSGVSDAMRRRYADAIGFSYDEIEWHVSSK